MDKRRKRKSLCKLFLVIILCIGNVLSLFSFHVYASSTEIKPYTESFNYIAYSYVKGIKDAPVNTAEHFNLCSSDAFAFNTIKGDLRLTFDNAIVMCHDAGFTFNDEGRITKFNPTNMTNIRDLTYDQCMSLQYEKKYKGHNVGVCDFETFISICKNNNKYAFITIRNKFIPELLNVMMPIIYKYGMTQKCIINSFSLNSLKLVRQYDSSIELSWVIRNGKLTKDKIDTASELKNCYLTLYCFPPVNHGGLDAIASYKDQIIYAQEKGVPLYTAIVNDATIIEQLKLYGISGAQIKTRINHINHVWDNGQVIEEPTYTTTGRKLFICTICGETKEEIQTLERTAISTCTIQGLKNKTYSGKKITQDVFVMLNGETLKNGVDYKISYKNNMKSGKAEMTITGMEKYKGTISQSFYIKPPTTCFLDSSSTKTRVNIKWNKAKSGTGYELQYRLKGKGKYNSVLIEGLDKNTKSIKKFKSGKDYQIRIRVYTKVGDKMLYSKWSEVKRISTK